MTGVVVVAVVAVVTAVDVIGGTVVVVVVTLVVGIDVVVDVVVALLQDDNIADTTSKQLNTIQRAFLGIISLLLIIYKIQINNRAELLPFLRNKFSKSALIYTFIALLSNTS